MLSLPALAIVPALTAAVPAAQANPLQDVARQFVRPENVTSEQAVAALLDARSILRDMRDVVASPLDSQERFYARKMWPAYAKWLREVGPSAPVVSGIIAGTDKEATLSEEYGGMAGQAAGPVDAVYIALGKVLTISGRTIREEAQISPAIIQEAQDAIEGVLAKVPQELLDSAQELRRQRASKQA